MHYACNNNNFEMVKILSQYKSLFSIPNKLCELPFQFLKSVEIFKYIQKFNINLNFRILNLSNDTLVHEVTKNGDIEKLKILLCAGLNYLLLNSDAETPLYSAYKYLSKHYFVQVLNTFISHVDNFDMNDDVDGSNTLLLLSLIEKEYMIVDAILDAIKSINLDINYKNNDGDTALHIAIKKNVPLRIIEKLLQCGADPTIKNNDNYSLIDNYYISHQLNDGFFIEKLR